MNADSRPPAAIRITRPYASEDEYLDRELDTLTRTSLTLVGAQPRPEGVVLRFEVALSSGQVLLRGEGRVIGYKPNAFEGAGGLSVRFTRLDIRTKALIDKAAALREKRRPPSQGPSAPERTTNSRMSVVPPPLPLPVYAPSPPSSSPASLAPGSLPPASLPAPSLRPASLPAPSLRPASLASPSLPAVSLPPPSLVPGSSPRLSLAPTPPPLPLARETLPLPAPQFDEPPSSDALGATGPSRPEMALDREELLARLRTRARSLEPGAVARMLEGRKRS